MKSVAIFGSMFVLFSCSAKAQNFEFTFDNGPGDFIELTVLKAKGLKMLKDGWRNDILARVFKEKADGLHYFDHLTSFKKGKIGYFHCSSDEISKVFEDGSILIIRQNWDDRSHYFIHVTGIDSGDLADDQRVFLEGPFECMGIAPLEGIRCKSFRALKKDEAEKLEGKEVRVAPWIYDLPEMRIWTDISGKFKMEAIYKRGVDGQCLFEKKDKTIVKVKKSQLSEYDQLLFDFPSGNKHRDPKVKYWENQREKAFGSR